MRKVLALLWLLGACANGHEAVEAPKVAVEVRTETPPEDSAPGTGIEARNALAVSEQSGSEPRPQPKPGERVRQPELDTYCPDRARELAFYYHGGRPVRRVAQDDGCAPLYITQCESKGHCYPPRDQEPGMWCCSAPVVDVAPSQQRRASR
ncbi:MAG: hypothetical protein OEZ06_02025 [Myxococcales bacterium]|nr:hypothetical protein [Myxococcales bacterium]